MSKHPILLSAGIVALAALAGAQTATLSNEPGPGTLSVAVDGYGQFSSLFFTPNNAPRTDTTFQSAVLFHAVSSTPPPQQIKSQWLTSVAGYGSCPGKGCALPTLTPGVVVPGRHVRSSFSPVPGWRMTLDQILYGPDPTGGPPIEGSTLQQIYTITNVRPPTEPPYDVTLIRYWDTDLASFSNDRAGASRQQADCTRTAPPFGSNRQWVFAFDPVQFGHPVAAASIEGVDARGQLIKSKNWEVRPFPTLRDSINTLWNGALTGFLHNDANLDLVVNPPEPAFDVTMANSVTIPSVGPGQTVTVHVRSRPTWLEKKVLNQELRARDITCITWGGNVGGTEPGVPILCVNGDKKCAGIQPGSPMFISLSSPPANPPGAGAYILYATIGNPKLKSLCGAPHAADFASWGPPIHEFGLGAFPVSSGFGPIWSGGGANLGFALASNIPGLGLLPGGPPGPAGPCQSPAVPPILTIPPLPPIKLGFTLQALVLDFGSRQAAAMPLSISNAVNVFLLPDCRCQDH